MISVSLLNFSFCSCIVSLSSLNWTQTTQSVSFLTDKWFLKIIIFNSFASTSQIPVSLALVTGKLLSSFGGVMFPCFFLFLGALCWCLHIWGSSHLFSAFSDWLWKRRVFTWKCLWDLWLAGVQQLWFWGKHSGIVSRQLHQQLRSTLAKTAGLCSGPDHRGPASGSRIYSCWGLQWQRLLEVFLFCLLEEFLAKGILFGARFSALALSGGGAGVLESGAWGSTLVLVHQCLRCRRVHVFMEPQFESLGLPTVICGPRMGRYSSGTTWGVQQRHTLGMVGQSPASGSRAQGTEQQQRSLSSARSKPWLRTQRVERRAVSV